MNYAIKNKRKIFFDLNQHLITYIKDEKIIKKSKF